MFYSSPECYLESIQKESSTSSPSMLGTYKYGSPRKMRWPIKIDDFFPYADVSSAGWFHSDHSQKS